MKDVEKKKTTVRKTEQRAEPLKAMAGGDTGKVVTIDTLVMAERADKGSSKRNENEKQNDCCNGEEGFGPIAGAFSYLLFTQMLIQLRTSPKVLFDPLDIDNYSHVLTRFDPQYYHPIWRYQTNAAEISVWYHPGRIFSTIVLEI